MVRVLTPVSTIYLGTNPRADALASKSTTSPPTSTVRVAAAPAASAYRASSESGQSWSAASSSVSACSVMPRRWASSARVRPAACRIAIKGVYWEASARSACMRATSAARSGSPFSRPCICAFFGMVRRYRAGTAHACVFRGMTTAELLRNPIAAQHISTIKNCLGACSDPTDQLRLACARAVPFAALSGPQPLPWPRDPDARERNPFPPGVRLSNRLGTGILAQTRIGIATRKRRSV